MKSTLITRWLPIPILVSSGIVAYDYHVNPTGWYDLALFFLPLTMVLTVLLLRRLPDTTPSASQSVTWQPFTRWHIVAIIAGVTCFVMIAQVQGTYPATLAFLFGMHHAHQFALWLLGIGLITWGMAGGLPLLAGWRVFRRWTRERDARWLLLIMLAGLLVRVLWLESAIHFYNDEANFASAVYRLRIQPNVQIMNNIGPVATFTWIYPYFQYYFTELFGATLANFRATSVIIGTLTIPAVYLLGRWGFNRRIGLLAAFLLAFNLPHIHFSRIAFNNIIDPLWGVLTIAFLWRGLQTGSRRMMALGGLCLGLTGYFYEGGRILYPVLIIAWLMLYVLVRKVHISKRGVAVFLMSGVLIASGFYLSLSIWGFQNFAPRYQQRQLPHEFWAEFFTSGNTVQQIMHYFDDRINPAYLHIMSQPDGGGLFYSSEVGLVMPYMLPFLLIGLGVAVYHGRRLGFIFLLWILLTVLGNSLLVWNNWTARFVVLFPALVIISALGLDVVYQSVIKDWLTSDSSKRVFQTGVMLLLGIMAIGQIVYYFGVMLPDYNVAIRRGMDSQDATFRAQELSPDTNVYIMPDAQLLHEDIPVMQAFERHTIPVNLIEVADFDVASLDPNAKQPYAFFIMPDDTATLRQLQEIFGARLDGPSWSPYDVPEGKEFALYQVDG